MTGDGGESAEENVMQRGRVENAWKRRLSSRGGFLLTQFPLGINDEVRGEKKNDTSDEYAYSHRLPNLFSRGSKSRFFFFPSFHSLLTFINSKIPFAKEWR